jgi:hypothetical protein
MSTPEDSERDLTQLDDTDLIGERAAMREKLERLPPHSKQRASLVGLYEILTVEFDRRARAAWANASKTEE